MDASLGTDYRREHAAWVLIYSGELPSHELVARLSVPGIAWDRGGTPAAPAHLRPRSGIRFESRLAPAEACEAHIADVLETIAPAAGEIAELLGDGQKFWGWLAVRAWTNGAIGGLSVSAEQLGTVFRLGLSLDVSYSADGEV